MRKLNPEPLKYWFCCECLCLWDKFFASNYKFVIELLSSSSQNSLFFSFINLFFSDVNLFIFDIYCNSFLRVLYPLQFAWIIIIFVISFSYYALVNRPFLYFSNKDYFVRFFVPDFLWPYGDILKLWTRDFYGVLWFE